MKQVVLAPGVQAPYPEPTSAAATAIGKANRRTNTKPEMALRSELHRRGLRFRRDYGVRTSERLVRVDVAFTRAKLAVLVDGCFWHGCPEHQRIPKSNQEYWIPKLKTNRTRDERVNRLLAEAGWTVLRIWEHETPAVAADDVQRMLKVARSRAST